MCKCNQNNKCNCNQNPCGCEKIDAKCVLYNGVCLSNLGICADTDLEEIIIIIDGLIQDILEQIEEAWTAANIGGGAEVYKGISSLGIHQFRTLIDSVSVNVVENENNISLAVDEAWLEDVIIRIVEDIVSQIPDTELDSPLNSISITSSSTNEFDIDINPNTFTSLNGSVTVTSNTLSGDLIINLQVNPSYINSLLPNIVNVGTGADIYKGLNGNNHEFRGITTQVTQPSTTNNQITGTVGASATVAGDNVQVNLDFSNLRVPLQQVGIPEYYVHSAADASVADGSIVRPYKTWDACKVAIIGSGTFHNPQNNGVKVIFQTNISSTEDLTIKNVSYRFENNSVFTYSGTDTAVFDMDKLKANTNQSQHNFEGSGTLRGIDKSIILRAGALSPTVSGESYFSVTIKAGASIVLEDRLSANYINTNFEVTDNGAGNPCRDGARNPVYVLKKTGGTDVVPPNEGILSIKGHNFPVWQPFGIEPGGILTVRTSINRAVYVYDANLINYGSLIFDASQQAHPTGSGSIACVRYSEIDPTIIADEDPEDLTVGRYKPSETVSLMHINTPVSSPVSSSGIQTSSSGFISGFLLGSTNQGGFNAVVELAGKSSSFQVTSNSPMTWNNRMRYNYLVYVADLDVQVTPNFVKRVQINNIYSHVNFQKAVLGGVPGIDSSKFILSIDQGALLQTTKDKIITASVTSSITDVFRATSFLHIAGEIYNTLLLSRNYADNADAISHDLSRGMLYITNDGIGSSILKIVH